VAILANSEIFGRYRKRVRLPKFEGGGALSSIMDIRTSDFVVHEKHGIGRYSGLKNLKVGGLMSEYLTLEYKGGDRLYVPIFELQQVQKYMGAEGKRPPLSSLDGAAWERIKSKVKEDVAKLAADLLRKAAKRTVRPGFAYPSRTRLEEEFAASFIYSLTPDQAKTLEEVERDMMAPRAMDRLICGDVGYGKTEVAMRAALKSALAAKQVCLLCPTTILAEQHARNFIERFADYPVTVNFLSRFQDKAKQKEVLDGVANGSIDVVIGTHRLLSKDVRFKDLGLLIIDEEHRFGVKQKSKLLSLRETVDVLSLTATPIPRTLASALGGIKDLSVIETAPEGRLPISTHVGLFDEDLMVKAVQTELDRGGQVFYVHNRVKTLLARKEWLESVLPNIRIAMAHGQMKEDDLEKAMHDFLHRNVDVLLATTIIESGLDIPSVNTLVVEEAEEMGLAQLYQLRGRVGRSRTRAYCYLFYGMNTLTTDAKRRLDALKEFTTLGSGIRLAMRDMEIRGAGNLLGPQQHGSMAAVGIETYSRLLNEEIQRMKGEQVEQAAHGPVIELSLSAYLPDDYLPSESERVVMYKRILSARREELAHLKEELIDRCGPLPEAAKLLFDAAGLRLIAKQRGISGVHEEAEGVLIYFNASVKLPQSAFDILLAHAANGTTLIPGPPAGVRVALQKDEAPLDALGRFLRLLFPS
jgi:transcription-repair coupling factor (superfamily II helicase)